MKESALLGTEAAEIVAPAAPTMGEDAEKSPSGYIIRWAVAQPASMARPDAARSRSSVTRRVSLAGVMPPLALVPTTKYYPVVGLASWNRMSSRPLLHSGLS